MFSSAIYTDLAADRRRSLIAAADAHRMARLARLRRCIRRPEATPPASPATCAVVCVR